MASSLFGVEQPDEVVVVRVGGGVVVGVVVRRHRRRGGLRGDVEACAEEREREEVGRLAHLSLRFHSLCRLQSTYISTTHDKKVEMRRDEMTSS